MFASLNRKRIAIVLIYQTVLKRIFTIIIEMAVSMKSVSKLNV